MLRMNEHRPCRCDAYGDSDGYDPNEEERAGTVRVVSTTEPGWSMTYRVQCAACGREFIVKQIDGPALRWEWVPRGVKRKSGQR